MDLFSLLISAVSLLQLLIVVRIVLSYFPGAAYTTPGRVLASIVDPILAPFRRILPTFGGIDFSPVLAILVLYLASSVLDGLRYGRLNLSGSIAAVVVQLILAIIGVFCLLILIRVVMSFFHASPFHPLVLFIREVTNPLVRPFTGIGPSGRGLDVAAVIAFAAFLVLFLAARLFLLRL